MPKSREERVLIVPNEDGFGPSSLAYWLAREFLDREGTPCHLTVWNRSRIEYNRGLYETYANRGQVELVPVWNMIQLDKDADGRVSIPGTLSRIGNYREKSLRYPDLDCRTDFDLVVDFGVPAAARWAASRGINATTVFDHAWSVTLAMIGKDQGGTQCAGDRRASSDGSRCAADRQASRTAFHPACGGITGAAGMNRRGIAGDFNRKGIKPEESDTAGWPDTAWCAWQRLAQDVAADEREVRRVFLFPSFLTPAVFSRYWRSVPDCVVSEIRAVFGGRPSWSVEAGRRFLDLREPGFTILIQGGDTPAWDHALGRVAPALVKADLGGELARRSLNIVLYVPARLAQSPELACLNNPGLKRLRQLAVVPGGTMQEILPVFDFMITRAGGGSVNDAVACRVPFVCVRESGMSQVEALLEAAIAQNLTRPVEPGDFEEDPLEVILAESARTQENEEIAERLRAIPCGGERAVAETLLPGRGN